jgi:hypothetical protein
MLRKIHLIVSTALAVSTISLAAGCAVDDPAAAAETGDGDVVYRTTVKFSPDGHLEQRFEVVTPDQQRADNAEREAYIAARERGTQHLLPTLGVERVCSGDSLWLYDQANRGGNQLCLIKAAADDMAWLDLGTICRTPLCLSTWNNAVRSLWAGVDPGSLQACTATLCWTTPFLNFGVFQLINSVAAGTPHPLNWAFLFDP